MISYAYIMHSVFMNSVALTTCNIKAISYKLLRVLLQYVEGVFLDVIENELLILFM